MQANAGVSRSGRVRKKSAKLMEMEDFDATDIEGGGRGKKKSLKTSDDSEHEKDKKVAPLKISKGTLGTKLSAAKSLPTTTTKLTEKTIVQKSPPLAAAKSPPPLSKAVTIVSSSSIVKPVTVSSQPAVVKSKASLASTKGVTINPPVITAKPPVSALKPSTVVAKPTSTAIKAPDVARKVSPTGNKTPAKKRMVSSPVIAEKKEIPTGKATFQQKTFTVASSIPVGKTLVPIPSPKPTPAIRPTLFPLNSKNIASGVGGNLSESSSSDDDSSNDDDSDSDMDSDEADVPKPVANQKDSAWHLKIKGSIKAKRPAPQGNAASKQAIVNIDDDSDADTMDSLVIVENGLKTKKKLTKKTKVPTKSKLKSGEITGDSDHGTPKSFKGKIKGTKGRKKPNEKKRPMSAYMLWCQENRKKIVSQNPEMDFSQISKRLGEIWHSLPENEKMTWKRKAKKPVSKGSNIITTGKSTPSSHAKATPPLHLPPGSPLKSGDELSRSSYEGGRAIGTTPLDVASHLKLLGESLSIIGQRLTEHEGQIAVSGSLSVLLDSTLCALGPLLCLTSQSEEMNGCSQDTLSQILDNVAYIMPGL